MNPTDFGAESGDVGVFERVLEELLDPDIEGDNLGVLISPHPLPPSSTVWERGNQAPLCRAAGEGLGVRAIITEPHSLPPSPTVWERGNPAPLACAAGEGLGVRATITEPYPPTLLSVNGEGGSDAPRTHGSLSPFTEMGLGGEVTVQNGSPSPTAWEQGLGGEVVIEVGSPSPAQWERGSGGEGMFLNEQSASAGQGQTVSALTVGAEGDALPVPSARQEETPPAPKRLIRLEPALSEIHAAPAHHAPLSAHPTSVAAPVDALPPNAAEPLAEPNWRIAEQITQHIERMVYDREREAITVRLDPPELGMIELHVQTTGNEVQAWVNAERDLTRQMLQQAQQQLREQLESRGLQLTHFDVGGQSNSHFAQARPFRTPTAQSVSHTHPSTATDRRNYDGRWSVWV